MSQIKITNLHVRYEDATSHAGHPFAIGVTLDSVSVNTTNELGENLFVNRADGPVDQLLYKVLRMRNLAV